MVAMVLLHLALAAQPGEEIMDRPVTPRILAWRRTLDDGSLEHATLKPLADGLRMQATILAVEEGAPLRVDYVLDVDGLWRSRTLQVKQEWQGQRKVLYLARDETGAWRINGQPAPELDGCMDVDLGLSPLTNTMPIRRLLKQGRDAAEFCMAWVRFPGLRVERAMQRYQRLGEKQWRYEGLSTGFSATVDVDEEGFVTDYAGIWRRVGAGEPVAAASPGFVGALVAPGPARSLGKHASDFDWLVGGWRAKVRDIDASGRERHGEGEWWFAWVLEGRALQDVWISPPPGARGAPPNPDASADRYGTSIRRLHSDGDGWRVTWINPVSGSEAELIGRREGDLIVLNGLDDGVPIRWRFLDIREDHFRWQGHRLAADGETWRLEAEFVLSRIGNRE